MNEPPDTFDLQSVEQLRAIADELRQRILRVLSEYAHTVTQVGEDLGIATAKIHYHVKELERVGLVTMVSTRENRGILEKYYRAVAASFNVPGDLLQALPPDESVAAATGWMREIARSFERALLRASRHDEVSGRSTGLSRIHLWLSDEEFAGVMDAVEEALEPYQQPRGVEGERERTFVHLMYDTRAGALSDESDRLKVPRASTPPSRTRTRRAIWVGGVTLDRKALERYLQRGEKLEITALGAVTFDDDVSPDLVDRVVVRLRQRGTLNASPEIRALLENRTGRSST